MPKHLTTSCGKRVLVDESDFRKYQGLSLRVRGQGYASISINKSGKTSDCLLAREIMDCPKGMEVDHINGNRMDNRRENLRICTLAENRRNRKLKTGKKLPKGITMERKRFLARIMVDGKPIHLGSFNTLAAAEYAYNEASKKYHGEFGTHKNLPVPPCDKCGGSGVIPMSKAMSETMSLIIENPGCTASFIFEKLKKRKFDRSFVNSRLKRLTAMGFIKSKKEHRCLRSYWPAR